MVQTNNELYRIRKSWNDTKSQIGAYSNLSNAKNACDKAGAGFFVFNSSGTKIYPLDVIDFSYIDSKAADPKVMWDYFKQAGLNNYGVAGLMGNLYAESGLRACNLQNTYENSLSMTDLEYTAAVDAKTYKNFVYDSAGYGLAQWTFWSLKKQMLEYFQAKNKSIGDLETQMEFLVYQLSTHYKSVWTDLKNAKSVREASDIMLLRFERPADQSEEVQQMRAQYGQIYYDKFATEIPTLKYSDLNPPLVCMATQSTCYRGTTTMTIVGVLWHSTGANNPTLKRYVQPSDNAIDKAKMLELIGVNKYKNDFNHITREAGLNAWIGKLADGTVTTIQTMPWNYKPWGCGSGSKGSCNNGWIQFEICEDDLTNEVYFNQVYKEACELTAYLCYKFDIDPFGTVSRNGVKVPTILCHKDSYNLKMGSNHGDVLHWFTKFGKTMEDVRKDVAALIPAKKQEENIVEDKNVIVPGDIVTIKDGATYYKGQSIPAWVMKLNWIVDSASGDCVIINKSTDNSHSIMSPIHVKNLIKVKSSAIEPQIFYYVRTSWDDLATGKGKFQKEENAIEACKQAGVGYSVFDSNGKIIFSTPELSSEFKVGDEVSIKAGAKWTSGATIPNWVFKSKLYIRAIRPADKTYVLSTQKSGAVTGVIAMNSVQAYQMTPNLQPYYVTITASSLNVRSGPGTSYKINTTIHKNEIYTIVDEKDGWGKLKSGAGWISLNYTKKL